MKKIALELGSPMKKYLFKPFLSGWRVFLKFSCCIKMKIKKGNNFTFSCSSSLILVSAVVLITTLLAVG
jgi:hypothetical protein